MHRICTCSFWELNFQVVGCSCVVWEAISVWGRYVEFIISCPCTEKMFHYQRIHIISENCKIRASYALSIWSSYLSFSKMLQPTRGLINLALCIMSCQFPRKNYISKPTFIVILFEQLCFITLEIRKNKCLILPLRYIKTTLKYCLNSVIL